MPRIERDSGFRGTRGGEINKLGKSDVATHNKEKAAGPPFLVWTP